MKSSQIVALALVFALAVPAVAQAGPVVEPRVFLEEGFESATPTSYVVAPEYIGPAANGNHYWGRLTQSKRNGGWGLWCATTPWTPTYTGFPWPNYPAKSSGNATFELPQLADYYQARLEFWYTMPSLGVADGNSFGVHWKPEGASLNSAIYGFAKTPPGQWRFEAYDLTSDSSPISRQPGRVWFRWVDMREVGDDPFQGQGPTIDDVVLRGWKYGPVRSMAVVAEGATGARVNWQAPVASFGGSATEIRPIVYDVYRRLSENSDGQWDAVVLGTSDLEAVVPSGLTRGRGYTFAVQARDPGEQPSGYGEPVYRTLTLDNAAPVSVDDVYSAEAGSVLTVGALLGVLANDGDPNADTLTASVATSPQGELSLRSDGGFTYTPKSGFSGTDTFTYRASDGTAEDVASVSIDVAPAAAEVSRVEGYDRYAVAEVLARRGWDRAGDKSWPGVTDVIIANGEDGKEADPLAAAGLAGAYNAPVLLIRASAIPKQTARVLAEIAVANPGVRVHVVGGTTTVPPARWNELKAIPGVSKNDYRIAGRDRYEVTAIIAERMAARLGAAGLSGALIINVENRNAFYDALAVSPQAYEGNWAMLGVRGSSVPPSVAAVLSGTLKGKPRHVVNAAGYVGQPVYSAVGATERYATSTDHYRASTQIAAKVDTNSECDATTVGIASKLPDALTGGVFLGRQRGLMVFTGTGPALQADAAAFLGLNADAILTGIVLGGPASVPASQETAFAALVE